MSVNLDKNTSTATEPKKKIRPMVGRIALNYVANIKAMHAEYYADRALGIQTQYCVHGTYIGTWWGPDYLCGRCESGDYNIYAEALAEAEATYDEFERRLKVYAEAHEFNRGFMSYDDLKVWQNQAIEYAMAPISNLAAPVKRNLP